MPRVLVLRSDEPIGERMDGCGNHILNLRHTYKTIFSSNADGSHAWMNLNGHNVELEIKETHLLHRSFYDADAFYRYAYKGGVQITLRFQQASDYISAVPATLIIRRGRISRTYRAEVAAQCD